MKKHALLIFGVFWVALVTFTGIQAGIIPAIIPLAVPTANRTAGATSRFAITDNSENLPLNGSLTTGNGGVSLGAVELKDPVNGGVYTVTTSGGASNFMATFPAVGGIIPLIAGTPTPGDCTKWTTATTLGDITCGGGGGGTGGGIGNITAVTAAANTTSDQTLQELTVTSGFYNAAAQVSALYGSGIYSIATGITPTLTWKVKLCTVSGCGSGTVVTLATFTTTATTALSSNYPWNINLTNVGTHATGATGNLIVHGFLAIDLGASAATAETVFNDANTAVSSNIDLTGALFVDFTVAASSGSTSNSFTQQYGATYIPGSNSAGGGSPGGTDTQWQYRSGASTFGGLTGTSQIPQTGWSLMNCSSSCLYNDFSAAIQSIFVFDNGSQNWRLVQRTLPSSTSYTLIESIQCVYANAGIAQLCGMYISDGTKLEGMELGTLSGGGGQVRLETMNSTTSDNATAHGPTTLTVGLNATLKVVNDGTHRTWSYWSNGAFVQYFQEATGTFLTETTGGFGAFSEVGNAINNSQAIIRYLSLTTP